MNEVYLSLTGFIKKIAGISPAYALGSLFGANIAFYIVLMVAGFIFKDMRRAFRHALYVFTNITALIAAVYCLAESLYYANHFNLLSSLLTVCLFYVLSLMKVVFYPLSMDLKRLKMRAANFKKKAYCSAPSEAYLPMPEDEIIKVFDRIAYNYSKKLPELSNLTKITKSLEQKDLSVQDKHELFSLQSLAARLKASTKVSEEELSELNDRLGALLKLLSKYQAEI